MNFRKRRAFATVLVILLIGCTFNPFYVFYTNSSVGQRFNNRQKYPDVMPPTPVDPDNFSFLVITDTHYQGSTSYAGKINPIVSEHNVEFIFVAGDIVNTGQSRFYDLYKNDMGKIAVPCYTVMGNHDVMQDASDTYLEEIGRSVYSFFAGSTLFIILDTANGTLGDAQLEWYQEQLEQSAANKIVITHFSPFNFVIQHPVVYPYPEEKYLLLHLNRKSGVDYFLSGHMHDYDERNTGGVQYVRVESIYDSTQAAALLVSVKGNKVTHKSVNLD